MTAARFRSATRAQQDDDRAREWLESNRLADGVSGHDDYVIAESFVRYLSGAAHAPRIPRNRRRLGSRPAKLIELYESGWREWLGLTREYNAEQGGTK